VRERDAIRHRESTAEAAIAKKAAESLNKGSLSFLPRSSSAIAKRP